MRAKDKEPAGVEHGICSEVPVRVGWAYFVSFQKAAQSLADLAKTKLPIPVCAFGGENGNGEALGEQVKLVASDATVVVLENTGHRVMEENPKETTGALMRFLGR